MKTFTRESVLQRCDAIRRAHPDEPFGDHWECFGVLVGDDVWGDPQVMGMPGEMEYMALSFQKNGPSS
jgi:hypothetical protein